MLWTLSIVLACVLIVPRFFAMFFPTKWFGFCAVITLIPLSVIAFFIDKLRYVGVPAFTTEGYCATLCSYFFAAWIWLNPQIRIQELGSTVKLSDIPKGCFLLTNHTSFFDSMMMCSKFPSNIAPNVKTCVKSTLANIPVFGPMFRWCGHFPVYFKSGEGSDFSVDKEKQEKVMARVNAFVASKTGQLALCPEGVMNNDPFKILPFRHGSFALAVEHKCPIYGFVHFGCHIMWPIKAAIGGIPAHIKYRVVKFDVSYEPVDGVPVTAGQVADQCRLQMQKTLDSLLRAS